MVHKNKVFILLVLFLFVLNFFLNTTSFANETNKNIRSDIDNQYKDNLRRFEIENRTKAFKKTEESFELKETQNEQKNIPKKLFSNITVEYDKTVPYISKKKINKIIKTYKNLPIGITEIKEIQHNLQKLFTDKGYIFTKVYINADLLKQNILAFIIDEGHIEKIQFKHSNNKEYHKLSNDLHGVSFFPFNKNSSLNIKDLDQGTEQLSRLSSSNANINIVPAQKDGYYIIEVINDITNRVNLSLGLDNAGFDNTGMYRANTSFSCDDILMLNDNLNFTYTKNFNYNKDAEDNYSYFAYLSIPI